MLERHRVVMSHALAATLAGPTTAVNTARQPSSSSYITEKTWICKGNNCRGVNLERLNPTFCLNCGENRES
jgi:hypothetical protein